MPRSRPERSSVGHPSPSSILTRTIREGDRGKERVLVYEVPEESLGAGSSLGNAGGWINSKATGALERLFCLAIGEMVTGALVIRYSAPQHGLMYHGRTDDGKAKGAPVSRPESRVQLEQTRPGVFRLHPAYQERIFSLPGGLEASETLFMPNTPDKEPAVAYQIIEIRNGASTRRSIQILAYLNLRGATPDDVTGKFDETLGAILAWNESQPDWVRAFGFSEKAASHMTTHDVSRAYDPVNVLPLREETSARGTIFGIVQANLDLAAGETRRLAVILGFSAKGKDDARRIFSEARDYESAFADTVDHYKEVLDVSRLETPDPIINQGVQWCKANMLRVMGDYPVCPAFTNEPGVSSNVVIRDLAWFGYGNDWMKPGFTGELLRATGKKRYPNGKIPEYFNAITGKIEDYGLNVNDDTPLFILAVCHHYFATRDTAFIDELFPVVQDAARYLLTQRDDRGLIFCSATGQNVWGIAGWRNVIPDYSINGAVTEINSLSYGALKAMAGLANHRGWTDAGRDLDHEAETLKKAINHHLLNPDNGMYYLNIDVDGNCHTDVTSDEVFPVMFKVAPEDVAFRIISRLNSPDFWTEAGLRVLSEQSPYYDPSMHVGLLGGVWPGVVFWYAFAAAKYHPEFMIRGLHEGHHSYLTDPRKNNTVPGQFSEWFDGQSLVNRGMKLSPWEPPRYLWAAIEGLAGATIGPDGISLEPRLPAAWKWLSLSRLPFDGREISFFAAREDHGIRLYLNEPAPSPHPVTICGRDVADRIENWSNDATVCAFQNEKLLHVCIGNSSSQTLIVPWTFDGLLEKKGRYRVKTYNSEYGGWLDGGEDAGGNFMGLAAAIEQQGFTILQFERIDGPVAPSPIRPF